MVVRRQVVKNYSQTLEHSDVPEPPPLTRRVGAVAINLSLYILIVTVYFATVLQWLNGAMAQLFRENLDRYAIASVPLILGQGISLGFVTSGLLSLGKWMSSERRD